MYKHVASFLIVERGILDKHKEKKGKHFSPVFKNLMKRDGSNLRFFFFNFCLLLIYAKNLKMM